MAEAESNEMSFLSIVGSIEKVGTARDFGDEGRIHRAQ
jgi:hypothetical protein